MIPYPQEELRQYNHLMAEIDAAYHEAARRLGLSDSAMMILYILCSSEEGSRPLADISRLTGMCKQTVHSALRRLESEGAVTCIGSGGRGKRVTLTARGQTVARRTAGRVIDMENAIFNTWSAEERTQYLTLTRRYLTALDERVRELSPEDPKENDL